MAKFRFSDEALERIFSKEQMGSVPLKYQSIVVHAAEEVIGELGNAYEFQSVGTFEQADISDTWWSGNCETDRINGRKGE